MSQSLQVEATQLYFASDPDGEIPSVLGIVVPGGQVPALKEIYRKAALDGSQFQEGSDVSTRAQWGVESQTRKVHLFVGFDDPPLALDVMVPANGNFQRPLRAAYERPQRVDLLTVLYDSESDAEQAHDAVRDGDAALWQSLGVAVGAVNLDMRPLALVFGS